MLSTIKDLTRSKVDLVAENALLRQQLSVLNRQVKKPSVSQSDRLWLVLLASRVKNWKAVLLIFKPDTLLRWHRQGFRLFWKFKSRNRGWRFETGIFIPAFWNSEVKMFESPEFMTLAKQMNETIKGKHIKAGNLNKTPHRFVWHNVKPDEFAKLTVGKTIGKATSKGKWLFVALEPGYVLVFGECGGKVLYHPASTQRPSNYHLCLEFDDGSCFSATTQMWGAMELYEKGKERGRHYIKDMRITPIEPEFTFDYFCQLIDETAQVGKTSAKGLLTQNQLIPGLGNAIAQDILFIARLAPQRSIDDLTRSQRRQLYNAIVKTVKQVIAEGGRYDEFDLYGNPGKYVRLMDKQALSRPCPNCGRQVKKIQYLGGACYFCPNCQK